MGDTTHGYVPHDYRRVCDICGELRNRSQLVERVASEWVCSYHPYERTQQELADAIASTRPIVIKPVPHPKPLDPENPNTFERDEMFLFNFIDQQITNSVRYEGINAGDGAPLSGQTVIALGWASRYLYNLIVENKRPLRVISRATTLLTTAVTALRARQVGFGISTSSTQATDAFYGGVLESGSDLFITEEVALAGYAFLYAYRLTGTVSWLVSAKAAASYLRNVQAIGSNGTNFTSSDSGGSSRLYTGGVASQVYNTTGFYSNHAFYPSDLITLDFWNALKTTAGDIDIGATAAVTGFDTVPESAISDCINDMRDLWEDGVQDSAGDTITGLSSTTPREVFNAYPATKTNFPNLTGTGRWEFQDSGATTGTKITGSNFAKALGALYAYEGASEQVTGISDWLRTFESNEDFETPTDQSAFALARSETGEFDPTVTLSTLLTVRDAEDDYAAIKINASNVYDWGAFGLLAPVWATRNRASFATSRVLALGPTQRFQDGKRSDGDYWDYVSLKGLSGLTYQTAFRVDVGPYSLGPLAFDMVIGREGRGSDLEFDAGSMTVPEGELTTFDFWRFTSVDDNGGTRFPFVDAGGEIPDGGQISFYNSTGVTLQFLHMGAESTSELLPFSLIAEATANVPIGYIISFVRDGLTWLQLNPPSPGLTNGAYPFLAVNDTARSAQFGNVFRYQPKSTGTQA